jgi:hypothetical protein
MNDALETFSLELLKTSHVHAFNNAQKSCSDVGQDRARHCVFWKRVLKVNDWLRKHQPVKDVKDDPRRNSDCGSRCHDDLFQNTILIGRVEAMVQIFSQYCKMKGAAVLLLFLRAVCAICSR